MPPVEATESRPATQTEAAGNRREPAGPRSSVGGIVRKIVLVLVILAAAAFAYWKIRQNKAAAAAEAEKTAAAMNRPIPVQVTPVAAKSMPIYLTALGTVTPYYSVTVKSRVDGQLMTVNVREGQSVRKGQLLAQIDPRPYQAALSQAQGTLAKDQATANFNSAEASRYTALLQAGVISRESQQTQLSNSGQSTGTLEADRAAIQAAQVNVAYTRITSPIDGVVGLRQVDPGNIVHAADTTGLLLVTQLQPVSVIFTLPEDQLPQVLRLMRGSSKLAVEAYDRSEATHLASGTLETIDNSIDTTTGTVKGKAVYPNRDNALFPNQFVNVRVVLQQRPNALVIPVTAIQNGNQGTFVFVVKPGEGKPDPNAGGQQGSPAGAGRGAKPAGGQEGDSGPRYHVEVQPVVVDVTEGSQVILKAGLNAGDQVVTDGQERLRSQSSVVPRQAAAQSNGPSTQPMPPANGSPGVGRTPQANRPDDNLDSAGSARPASNAGPARHGKGQRP